MGARTNVHNARNAQCRAPAVVCAIFTAFFGVFWPASADAEDPRGGSVAPTATPVPAITTGPATTPVPATPASTRDVPGSPAAATEATPDASAAPQTAASELGASEPAVAAHTLHGAVPQGTVSPTRFVQYGVGFVADTVIAHGPICRDIRAPCIFGDGAGVVANFGVALERAWYFGGAYQLTRRDPSKLYRLATLQELRVEVRRYQDSGKDLRGFLELGLGANVYGDLWGVDTYGPQAQAGIGAELELSRRSMLVVALEYRVAGFATFRDSSSTLRDAGAAQMLGIRVTLEGRERW